MKMKHVTLRVAGALTIAIAISMVFATTAGTQSA
jgi:hypothetical protein